MSHVASRLTLFDDIERLDHRHKRQTQSSFHFLNTSAWPASHNVRAALEQWFEDYPDDDKNDLRARFRKRDDNHESAFFELFLHEVFRRLGLTPEVHPEPSTGRGRPDFLVTPRTGRAVYVEANVVGLTGFMVEDPLEQGVLEAIDELATARPTGIRLTAHSLGKLATSPPARRIKNKVARWLEQVDRDFPRPGSIEPMPSVTVGHGDWSLTLTALHRSDRLSDRLVHAGPSKGGASTEDVALRKNVLEKAKQHGKLDRPLIVAMNTMNGFQSAEDEMSALFGGEQLTWRVDTNGKAVTPPQSSREPDSLWRNRSGNRYSRVHGVLFFRGVWPWNANNVVSHLYVNPYIDADIPDEVLRLGSARVRNGRMTWEAGENLGDLLDLPENWPGERTRPTFD